MALIARVSGDSWDWREESDVEDDGPLTSRSPSFVRIATSERFSTDPADLVTEAPSLRSPRSERHDSVGPASDGNGPASILRRWSDLDVTLRMRSLNLEETAMRLHDPQLLQVATAVQDETSALADALRALRAALEEGDDDAPAVPLAATYPVVQHVFEWSSNVVLRASELLASVADDAPASSAPLTIAEYSSLFVRAIIDPMLAEAIATHARARDGAVAAQLENLRQRVLWLNWAVRGLS